MKINVRGQSAVEYLLLLGVVAAVVMIAFTQGGLLGKTQQTTNVYFNSISRVIHGSDPAPISGGWCDLSGQKLRPEMSNGTSGHPNEHAEQCPENLPCGTKVLYRECACPTPAFGGTHCMESQPQDAVVLCPNTPACRDCVDNVCLAPEPMTCGVTTPGFMSCSGEACTKGFNCGSCPAIPANATVCPGSDQQVPEDTLWTMVSGGRESCGTGKCRAYCDAEAGSALNGSQNGCTLFQCTGNKPSGAVACPGSEATSGSWRAVYDRSACAHACEYYCGFGTHQQSDGTGQTVCATNQCAGNVPTGATLCANDNQDVPVSGLPMRVVTACSDLRKCEALVAACPAGTVEENHECFEADTTP